MSKTYKQTITHKVLATDNGQTVQYIINQKLEISRRGLQKLTRGHGILLNSKKTFLAKPVKTGDVLQIRWQEPLPDIEPINLDLRVLYEDDLCLIVDKPAFIPVHPSPNWHGPTLINGVAHYYKKQGKSFGIHPVARLDTNTTGIVVIAKNSIAHNLLDKVITSKSKTYQALVTGILTPAGGTLTAPIKSLPHSAKRLVKPDGQPATTHYHTIKVFDKENLSLIELKLETGRTHQIRVHMAHIGHPLLGDRLYGQSTRDSTTVKRYALHCCSLTFKHPQTEEILAIESEFDLHEFLAAF